MLKRKRNEWAFLFITLQRKVFLVFSRNCISGSFAVSLTESMKEIFVLIWTVFDVCVIDMWLSSRFDCICYGGWRWGILFHVTIPLGVWKLALHSISTVASERKVKRPSVSTYLTQDSFGMKSSFVCWFCMIENI